MTNQPKNLADAPDATLEALSKHTQLSFQNTVNGGASSRWVTGLSVSAVTAALFAGMGWLGRKFDVGLLKVSSDLIIGSSAASGIWAYEAVKATQNKASQGLSAIKAESTLKERAQEKLAANYINPKKEPETKASKSEHQVSTAKHDGVVSYAKEHQKEADSLTV